MPTVTYLIDWPARFPELGVIAEPALAASAASCAATPWVLKTRLIVEDADLEGSG